MAGRFTLCAPLCEYVDRRAEMARYRTDRTLRYSYENRTSLPGSISKSNTSESCVFGLITSSTYFT